MRYRLDTDAMLAKCRRLQWSVHDIDWDAPGREVVGDDMRLGLTGFMGDLYWIESVAAIVFDAMRAATPDPALSGIFATFSVDEQRHADAELGLMRRWGITRPNEIPAPNPNARNLVRALERAAGRVHPAVFSAIIPFTELVLDGALVKHLEARVADPVCKQVFQRINADEARHLAVDFHVLEQVGGAWSTRKGLAIGARALRHPVLLYGLLLGYLPLLARTQPSLWRIGITEEQLHACIRRYIAVGDESPAAARHPAYAVFRQLSRQIVSGHMGVLDLLLRLSDLCDVLGLQLPFAPAADVRRMEAA